MRALIQRVTRAKVTVAEQQIGETGPGLLVLLCAMDGDTEETAIALAGKTARLRIFKDEGGKMNRSVQDVGGSALVVSQFTLAADTRRGNRPGFSSSAAPDLAEALYLRFVEELRQLGVSSQTGAFGADMQISLTNDGPVTIWLDTNAN